jgi:predicted tellurium resistance membrane protein TerC
MLVATMMLALAVASVGLVFVTFTVTTLVHEPASLVTMVAVSVLGVALDFGWKRARAQPISGGEQR